MKILMAPRDAARQIMDALNLPKNTVAVTFRMRANEAAFSGSGTTAKAAKTLGRQFIGLEVNPEYCQIAERRIVQEVLALA